MSMVLEARREGGAPVRLPLREGYRLRLGAGAACELRFEGEPQLSGTQAELRLQGGQLSLRKQARACNPVYFKGEDVHEARLKPGDCFVVGRTRFVLREGPDDGGAAPSSLPQHLQLLDLLELPEILRLRSPEEALAHVATVLRLVLGARWVEIRGPQGLQARDAEQDRDPGPADDPGLWERARSASPNAVWALVEDGWTLACSLPVAGTDELRFLVAGGGPGGPSLEERARLASLIADMAARNLALHRLEDYKRRLERFFSGPVASTILDTADTATLEPRLTRAAVMFFDIRGFSRLAESSLETALASVKQLRAVMTAMTEEIFNENGVVIQFMGDGILACWNLPYEDARAEDHACRAAVKMAQRLRQTAPDWRCGIGIHAGDLVAGSLGSEQVFSYTVMGAVVNQASRVEGITKVVEAPILATAEVVSRLTPGACRSRRLGRYQPAGMSTALELHQILPADSGNADAASLDEALQAFEAGDWERAYSLLDPRPSTDLPARYLKALAEMHRRKPPKDWRGVIELDAK